MVPDSGSVKSETNPGRQVLDSTLPPLQKGTHAEWICGVVNDSLFCPRFSARGLWNPVVVWKHICSLWCTSHQEVGPAASHGNWVGLCDWVDLWGQVRKHSVGSTWLFMRDTGLWSAEPPWKKFTHSDAAMLERPGQKEMPKEPQLFETSQPKS